MQPEQPNLPIGYWIKKADEMLTNRTDLIHKNANITRVGWQLLHTIHERENIDVSELIAIIAPFANKSEAEAILKDFASQRLLHMQTTTTIAVSLTSQGKQFYQECLEKQKIIRQKAMEGITKEAYQIAVQMLQKMVSNLEN